MFDAQNNIVDTFYGLDKPLKIHTKNNALSSNVLKSLKKDISQVY